MRAICGILTLLTFALPAQANDWEKFYTPLGTTEQLIPSNVPPETVPSMGDLDRDVDAMWRRGYTLIGYSYFNTGNSKTQDASRFAAKLKARYLIVGTQLISSHTSSIPFTSPTTNTTYNNGTVNAYGSGGSAHGTYSGTSTTTGSQTTYIPITVNRFNKLAAYFMEVPKYGAGIIPRELTPEETQLVETRRAFAVRFVRDRSPAYNADLLPGDIIMTVNDQPADEANWQVAIRSGIPLKLKLIRHGQIKSLELTIPEDWRPSQRLLVRLV